MYHTILLPNCSLDYHRDVFALLIGCNHLFILFLVRLTEDPFLCPACPALCRTLVTPNVLTEVNPRLILSCKALGKPLSYYFLYKTGPLLAPPVVYPYSIENAIDSFIRNFRLKVLSDLSITCFQILSYE